jgi:L-fuculose-phosphate aldolase
MTTLRAELIATARKMTAAGLNKGTAGNLSARDRDGFLITPTGMDYDTLTPSDLVFMRLDGSHEGTKKPSSEWRFHRDLYAARPAFHYMIARFGGDTLRCADYATFGTQALSDHALKAMADRSACLLANHGMLLFGKNLKQALDLGIELECLCEQYWRACQLGEPTLLDAEEMRVVLEKFSSYGQQG